MRRVILSKTIGRYPGIVPLATAREVVEPMLAFNHSAQAS